MSKAIAAGAVFLQLVGFFVILSGCDSPSPEYNAVEGTVEGIVVDVQMCEEDGVYTAMMVEFSDGRVQKLRCRFNNPVVFHLNKNNTIVVEDNGTIIRIEVESEDER